MVIEVRSTRQATVASLIRRGYHRCAGDCSNHYVRLTNFREHAFICQSGPGIFEVKHFRETLRAT